MTQSIGERRDRLFTLIPDGKTVPWDELLKNAGPDQGLVKALVFGKPTSVARVGENFTARGEEAADMPPLLPGVTVHSGKVVKFTLNRTGVPLKATNITGVTVTVPILGTFDLTWANVNTDSAGNTLLTSGKFMARGTILLGPDNKYKGFRLGN